MICRVCLEEVDCPLKIFDANGGDHIAQILEQHFWFTPVPDDSISTVLCHSCWLKIADFHRFYLSVEEAHKMLSDKTEPANGTNIEICIKEELIDNVWQVPTEDEQETKNPLYEPEVLVTESPDKNEDANNETTVPLKTDHEDESSDESEEDQIHKKGTQKSSCILGIKTRKRTTKLDSSVEGSNEARDSSKQKRQRRHMISPLDDEIIKKHIPMGCDLCPFVGEDFVHMTKHFREHHIDIRPYVMCCGRKLAKRFLIVQHAHKHEDPEYFKCNKCNKVFSDGYVLRSHNLANHAAEDECVHECDQCPKKFSRRYLLELHRPSHIPVNERKFICDKCPLSKAFASDHLLQIHTNMRHTKATNVCHVCAKEIRDNQAFQKHVRLHFEDSGPRVKCPRPDCDRWLKDADNLKQHLRRHNDEGKTFTCDECGKVCKNRRSLTSHFNYAHTNAVFSCDECHKTFKKAITLKEHMAQHTGETLYKCPFCARTFNSNANMHSHKKKMHPIEWDIWRKTKRGGSQHEVSNKLVMAAVASSISKG